jgi:hypothetical protein
MGASILHTFRLLTWCLAGWVARGSAQAQTNVLFIFDASGSMKSAVGSDTRIGIAKRAMEALLKEMPPDARLGLMMYGHRRANDCTDLELVSPLGADDAATISRTIQAVQPKGETPIAVALRQAARSFAAFKGQNNSIVLVTDGIEECKGDPCAAAREIKASGINLKVDIVGFTLNDAQRKAIQCVPDATGGQYFEAQDAPSLNKALGTIRQRTAQAAPPTPPPPPVSTPVTLPSADLNLLSVANGGRLLMAPNDKWNLLNDGKDTCDAVYTGEGVWSFKDGKPATFDAVEVLVPEASQYNVKDVELFVGDDGPLGSFRSVGTLTVQNVKMMSSPYQRFTLPPTTGRFIKIALKSDWGGGYIRGCEIRLHGKVDDTAAAAPPAAPPSGIDLISAANGGSLLSAPNDEWKKLTTGGGERAVARAGEGVWAFKDEKPATVNAFEVLIAGTEQYNLKDFEVLVSDDSPMGPFRSIGTFSTVNSRITANAQYQHFPLSPTKARYLKVVLKTDWGGGYIAVYGIKLLGTP